MNSIAILGAAVVLSIYVYNGLCEGASAINRLYVLLKAWIEYNSK